MDVDALKKTGFAGFAAVAALVAAMAPFARAIAIIPPVTYALTLSIGTMLASAAVMLTGAAAAMGAFRGELFGKRKSELLDTGFRWAGKLLAALVSVWLSATILAPLTLSDAALSGVFAAAICFAILCLASYRESMADDSAARQQGLSQAAAFCVFVLFATTIAAAVSVEKQQLFQSPAESRIASDQQPFQDLADQSSKAALPAMGFVSEELKAATAAVYVQPDRPGRCSVEIAGIKREFEARKSCSSNTADPFKLDYCPERVELAGIPDGEYAVTGTGSCEQSARIIISSGQAAMR